MKSTGAMFIGVLRSETSQNSIIQQFDLQKVYGIRLLSDTRKKLDDNTAILEDRKSGIIAISVTDHSPQRAAAIANGYVDELNSLVAQLSTSAAHRERVFLEDRLKVAKQELDTATNQLAQFSSKNTTLDMQTEGKAMLDAASVLTGQLIVAQSELQGLRQIYTDNNPRVRALNGRVGELRKQLEKLGGTQESTQTNSAQDDASASGQSSNSTSGNVSGSPFPTIHNLPLLGAKYSDYYRRAKIQETVFELLTTQYELAKVQEAKETPSVKVLDPGRVPDRKSFPPRLLITVFGAMTAMAVMALWVLANNRWTQVDPADPRKLLALEVAATFRANSPWTSPNGDAPEPWVRKVWRRLGNLFPPANGPSAS
jgi:capsule polysaccharide export protein KpsE/RkpR